MNRKTNVLVKEREEATKALDSCHHYWMIEGANGPTSVGVCKHCGTEKTFYNSVVPEFNAMKRHANPLELPEMPEIDFDGEGNRQ